MCVYLFHCSEAYHFLFSAWYSPLKYWKKSFNLRSSVTIEVIESCGWSSASMALLGLFFHFCAFYFAVYAWILSINSLENSIFLGINVKMIPGSDSTTWSLAKGVEEECAVSTAILVCSSLVKGTPERIMRLFLY